MFLDLVLWQPLDLQQQASGKLCARHQAGNTDESHLVMMMAVRLTLSTTSHVPTAFLSASQLLILTGTALRELTNIRTGQGTTKSSRLGSEGLKLPSRIGRHLGLSASHPAPTSPAAGRPKSFLTLALLYLWLQGSLHIPTRLGTCSIKIALK